ncbi:MAG: hypothetical protein OXH36_03455, partial [Bdellovibrionales bacterium]|nr:hypothetical protein [Bdellovibrionales bacterium]
MNKSGVDYYKPYSFNKKTLSNGLEVLLVKDKNLPYISFDMMFRLGSSMVFLFMIRRRPRSTLSPYH